MTSTIQEPVKVLTLTEAADVLRVGKRTVLSMIKAGLPARKIGRAWRIPVPTLNEWMENRQSLPSGQKDEPEPEEKANAKK